MMNYDKLNICKYSKKENLINELKCVCNLLENSKNAEIKLLIEGLVCLQEMIASYLADIFCKNKIFKVLKNDDF